MQLNDKILKHKIILNNVYALSENKLLVDFTPTSYHMPVPFSSNPILASFVTAYGRLELYKHMKIIGKNLVYTDTDSAYYFEKDNEITTKLDIGDSLGKMKDELSVNNYITLQICLASKTYGYNTFLPENKITSYNS